MFDIFIMSNAFNHLSSFSSLSMTMYLLIMSMWIKKTYVEAYNKVSWNMCRSVYYFSTEYFIWVDDKLCLWSSYLFPSLSQPTNQYKRSLIKNIVQNITQKCMPCHTNRRHHSLFQLLCVMFVYARKHETLHIIYAGWISNEVKTKLRDDSLETFTYIYE